MLSPRWLRRLSLLTSFDSYSLLLFVFDFSSLGGREMRVVPLPLWNRISLSHRYPPRYQR